MGILGDFLNSMGQGALESAALRSQGVGVPQKKGKRKAKSSKSAEDCTPCAAMAKVDSHRQRLGYSIK